MLNLALQKWRAKESSFGIWSNLPDIHMAEMLCQMDVDWNCFDLQHGLMDYSDLTRLLPAVTGVPVTVWLPTSRTRSARRSTGVSVPMVNTVKMPRVQSLPAVIRRKALIHVAPCMMRCWKALATWPLRMNRSPAW